jgi:hypothetical protein
MAAHLEAGVLGLLKQETLALAGVLALAGIAGGLAVAMPLAGIDAVTMNLAGCESLARGERRTGDRESHRGCGDAAARNESHFHLILLKETAPQRVRSALRAKSMFG